MRLGVDRFSFHGPVEIVGRGDDGILLAFFKYVLSASARANEFDPPSKIKR